MRRYGTPGNQVPGGDELDLPAYRRRSVSGLGSMLSGFGLGPRLACLLTRADVPLTAAEFILLVLGLVTAGFLAGAWRMGLAAGLVFGAALGCAPVVYVRMVQRRRASAFTEQLPEVLTLLVGALRAGHGLTQAIGLVAGRIAPPARAEFARVLNEVELGLSVEQALNEMAERVGTTDIDLVVTAISVQYEMGGNLAQTLDIIGETVRDRLRIRRQIRVLTAQQRLTGYILAILPVGLGAIMYFTNPTYMARLFEPGWIRLFPIMAGLMMVAGFVVINKILNIEV